ncbi:hypothetical protein D9757_014361 [Collybiopsis confluens]|uniref:Uncharacterized protein n=1 Tax=Collybiopsis confluens TaxID=2823264 RepID=A0A8H5FRG6_9AGAR|nr:hypothetical protein D9757_014361 [Collybiopsis confluens]
MLSSITSFLPSALQHINSNSHANPPPQVDEDDEDEEQDPRMGQVVQTKKKEKKEKPLNETFIIVRPPPAKTNHPLNLQVQLVPPNSRAPGVSGQDSTTPRQSLDGGEPHTAPSSPTSAESDPNGAPLARTPSAQSSRSEISSYPPSGFTSTSSFSSVASTASGRRMIIPLYNLQAHNVMTNTIVDAGTDAKIAKFTRKGLEMIDLAIMEIVEVWPAPSGVTTSNNGNGTGSARASLDEGPRAHNRLSAISNSHLRPQQNSSRPTTPEPERFTPGSSVVSVSSAGLSSMADEYHPPPEALPIAPIGLPPTKKNLFGKFFKKKDVFPSPDRTPTLPFTSVTPASPNYPKSPIKTPTPTNSHFVVPSPSPTSRHSRNSSANFGKRGSSASPSRPSTSESAGLGIRGLMKQIRPSSVHLDPNDVHRHDYAYDEDLGLKPDGLTAVSTTSSRISTASRMSNTLEPPPMSTGGSTTTAPNTVILPATLGIQPTLSSPGGPAALGAFSNFSSSGYPPPKSLGFGRGPALYVWVVRKWIKTAEGTSGPGLFGGMRDVLGSMGANTNGSGLHLHSPTGGGGGRNTQNSVAAPASLSEIEVRVEWKRGKKSKSSKKNAKVGKNREGEEEEGASTTSRDVSRTRSLKRQSTVASQSSPTGSNTSLPVSEATTDSATAARKKKNRLSTGSKLSMSTDDPDVTLTNATKFGRGRSKSQYVEEDDGNDSDPEDSETPWTCTLKIRRLASPYSSPLPTPIKVKTATLSPTPHHPKVVAMLKVPYPLPDVEIQTLSLKKRPVGPPGGAPTPADSASTMVGLALRAEEIKDMVCSTGLWVVVREGFGGVGKVSRKGDGWRIRA